MENNIDINQSQEELEKLEMTLKSVERTDNGFVNLESPEFSDFMLKLRSFYKSYNLNSIDNTNSIQQSIKTDIDKLLSNFDIYVDYEKIFKKTEENQDEFFDLFKQTLKNNFEQEGKTNEHNIRKLIEKLIINTSKETQKKLKDSKDIIDRLVAKMADSDRKEFIETLNVYMDIKKEVGEYPELIKIFENINNKNSDNDFIEVFSELMKDINRFSINKIYQSKIIQINNKNKEVYDLSAADKGIPDIQLFYLKDINKDKINQDNYKPDYQWLSKSASITKSAPYRFENIQNNTHSFKTLLKQQYLNKYLNDNSIEDFSTISNVNDFLEGLPLQKRERLKNKLDVIDSLSGDIIMAFEDLDLSFNQIEEYLETHRRYIVDVQRTGRDKYQKLNTVIESFVENNSDNIKSNNIENIKQDIELFLEDKNKYIEKRIDIDISQSDGVSKRKKKAIKVCQELIEYNSEDVIYIKNSYDHSDTKDYSTDNGYKNISSNFNTPLLDNQSNHNHSFVVINNGIIIDKFYGNNPDDNKLNDNKLNDNEKLSHFILLFSHLKNEINVKYDLSSKEPIEVFKLYFDKNSKIHESYSSKIIYSSENSDKVKISESNFQEIISEIDNDFIEKLNNIINERNSNKILTNNLHAAIDILIVYSKSNDVNVNFNINNLKPINNIEGGFSKDIVISEKDEKLSVQAKEIDVKDEENRKLKAELELFKSQSIDKLNNIFKETSPSIEIVLNRNSKLSKETKNIDSKIKEKVSSSIEKTIIEKIKEKTTNIFKFGR